MIENPSATDAVALSLESWRFDVDGTKVLLGQRCRDAIRVADDRHDASTGTEVLRGNAGDIGGGHATQGPLVDRDRVRGAAERGYAGQRRRDVPMSTERRELPTEGKA